MIVRGSRRLIEQYHDLTDGDVFIGTLSSKYRKSNLLIDLLERGIVCLPSALSQTLSTSKTTQAIVFQKYMLPHTLVIQRRHDLVQAINTYNRNDVGPVVTKDNHLHCGHGVRRWDHIEMLYSIVTRNKEAYPFVLQPLMEDFFVDIRVIWVADFLEAYSRQNPYNFRNNISAGGSSRPYELDTEQLDLCREVVKRGRFPFAHIDLMVLEDGKSYVSEIALDGGIKGARISREELNRLKTGRLDDLAATYADQT